jgi:hypothetical protein
MKSIKMNPDRVSKAAHIRAVRGFAPLRKPAAAAVLALFELGASVRMSF